MAYKINLIRHDGRAWKSTYIYSEPTPKLGEYVKALVGHSAVLGIVIAVHVAAEKYRLPQSLLRRVANIILGRPTSMILDIVDAKEQG